MVAFGNHMDDKLDADVGLLKQCALDHSAQDWVDPGLAVNNNNKNQPYFYYSGYLGKFFRETEECR